MTRGIISTYVLGTGEALYLISLHHYRILYQIYFTNFSIRLAPVPQDLYPSSLPTVKHP